MLYSQKHDVVFSELAPVGSNSVVSAGLCPVMHKLDGE